MRRVTFLFLSFALAVVLAGCDGHRKRPYGYLRLGPVSDYLAPETYLPDQRLLIRRDEGGLSVMSTECTHDLSPLTLRDDGKGRATFVSSYSSSRYTKEGAVISPPASAPLPYYNLVIDRERAGTPKSFLYVEIGKERPASWRLPIKIAD